MDNAHFYSDEVINDKPIVENNHLHKQKEILIDATGHVRGFSDLIIAIDNINPILLNQTSVENFIWDMFRDKEAQFMTAEGYLESLNNYYLEYNELVGVLSKFSRNANQEQINDFFKAILKIWNIEINDKYIDILSNRFITA